MRIRSIKPEFWRSQDIENLSRDVRLLFIGLWSYVDDNGVGVDDFRQIAADLFALADDPTEARNYVRDGLATLSRALLITRYEVDGRPFLFITGWDRHQRIDRPAKPRHPRPNVDGAVVTSENPDSRDTVATPSRDMPAKGASGTGEQGNRGTERTPAPPAEDAATGEVVMFDIDESTETAVAVAEPVTAQTIVAALVDACRERDVALPNRLIGQYAKGIKQLLGEGYSPALIWRALALMADDNILNRPSLLANKVVTAQAGPERAPQRASRSTTDDRVAGWLNLSFEGVAS